MEGEHDAIGVFVVVIVPARARVEVEELIQDSRRRNPRATVSGWSYVDRNGNEGRWVRDG